MRVPSLIVRDGARVIGYHRHTVFVVLLTYEKPLAEVDRLMREHVGFLEDCYRAGVFLACGRQVPRNGGVILAVSAKREDLDDVMQHDPFVREGVASYEIVEFRSSLHHPALAPFADPGTRAVREVPESSGN